MRPGWGYEGETVTMCMGFGIFNVPLCQVILC